MIESAEEFVLLRNSDNQEEYVRDANDEASLQVWNDVIKRYPDMALWVAHNKTVPYEILELLANHPESRVRSMVASKNKLKETLLVKLASDPDDAVRMSVARHKKSTASVLEKLSNDSWEDISELASERLRIGSYK